MSDVSSTSLHRTGLRWLVGGLAVAGVLTFAGCGDERADGCKACPKAQTGVTVANLKVLPPLNIKPKLFANLGETCQIPDALSLDGKGNVIVSVPNFVDYEKHGSKMLCLDANGAIKTWFTDLPKHPKTGKVHPMGQEFGPDGNLYIADNQYFSDKDHQSRILRIIMQNGAPVRCEVAVEGTKLSNAVRWKGNHLYMTDTFLDLPQRDQSGVWRFSLDEIGAGKPVLKVKPNGTDPHLITRFTAKPVPKKADGTHEENAGADGAAFDSQGNLYVGNFGDGQFFKITFCPDGSVASNTLIIDHPDFQCCDGIWCDQKTDDIYLTNSKQNSVWIYNARNHTFQKIWENDDNDGATGLLDQPCEPIKLGNKLIVVNFDMPFPGLKNQKHEGVNTLSYFELP